MGTNIASDLINENHQNNEQKLWRHVILNAMEDVRINNTDRKSALTKIDAHDWISESEDFDQICWWAGWDPEEIKLRYKKALKNFEITFHLKHIKWKEYNELYHRHRKEKNKEQRAVLRIAMLRARGNIGKIKSELISNIFLSVKV